MFHRYAEEGKTFIRNQQNHPVGVVKGWDSNSLYLSCLAKKSPTGRMIHRTSEQGFRPMCEVKQFYSIDFLDYIATKIGIFIQHKGNLGEKKITPFAVNGYYQPTDPRVTPEESYLKYRGVLYMETILTAVQLQVKSPRKNG